MAWSRITDITPQVIHEIQNIFDEVEVDVNSLEEGGMSNPMTTLGDMIYGETEGDATRLAGNTTTTKKFLNQTGNGSASAAPVWSALVAGDMPDLSTTYVVRDYNLADLSNVGNARENLGVAIGVDVQAWDADLDAIAALVGASGLLKKTAANTWTLDTSTYATQAYADSLVVGLLDDRGNYNASGNVFPSSGGSGSAGAILKGDIWVISVAGTLGGAAVNVGDQVRALVDSPGQTASNWAISEANIGYVPLSQSLADGKIYVGNGSGIGTAVTPSGDLAMSNAGVFTVTAQNSAFWRGKVTDETGTGLWVFNDSPTLITPNIGVASGTSLNLSGNITIGGNVASSLIPDATDTRDLGSSTLLWRKGWLSEMDAVLFAQNTISVIGGWLLIAKGEGTVDEDVDNSETQIDFGTNNIAVNDFIIFRAAGAVEYMQATSLVSGNNWNVTRNVDGSGANAWPQGSVWVNLGYNGTGRIELNASDTPRIQIITQGTTYNAQTELLRMGDLNGNWGYSAATYGFAAGQYGSAGASWITIDPTNGVRIGNNTTTKISLDTSGNASFTGSVTATTGSIGGFDIGADYIRDTANSFGLASTVTGGDDVRFWAGDTFANRASAPFRVTEAGVVTANSGLIGGWTVNSTAIQNAAATVILRGAGNLAFGATPPTSATVGTGLFLDSTGMYGLASSVQQAIFNATTGAITAGAGSVILDASGISLSQGSSSSNQIKWFSGDGTLASIYATSSEMDIGQAAPTTLTNNADTVIFAAASDRLYQAIVRMKALNGANASVRIYGSTNGITGVTIGANAAPNAMLDVRGDIIGTGVLKAGSTPTTLTDSAGKILSAVLNTVAVAQGGTGDTGTAWSSYTPTVSAVSGTFTSASATGAYKQLGKTVFFRLKVTITTNGTAAAAVRASLPVASIGSVPVQAFAGRENGLTGKQLNATVYPDTSTIQITFYDVSYPGANGAILDISGVYEAA